MPIKPQATAPANTTPKLEENPIIVALTERVDALEASIAEQKETFEQFVADVNEALASSPAPSGDEGDDPAPSGDEDPADDSTPLPTVAEIKKADKKQLKLWRASLFDETEQEKDLEEIRAELLDAVSADGATAKEEDSSPSGDEDEDPAPASDEDEDEDTPAKPSKPKKGAGTNGNVFGLRQDPKTGKVQSEIVLPYYACTTACEKAIKLATVYKCFFKESACTCAQGDEDSINQCFKEMLEDPELKDMIAKEKASMKKPASTPVKGKPALPAKKSLLNRK